MSVRDFLIFYRAIQKAAPFIKRKIFGLELAKALECDLKRKEMHG